MLRRPGPAGRVVIRHNLIAASPVVAQHPDPAYRVVLLWWPGKGEFSVHDRLVKDDGTVCHESGNWFSRIEDATAAWVGRVAQRFANANPGAIRAEFLEVTK